eukprot:SM000178S03463  [mRNA]  locus=s178:178916:179690:+ [translate_table: standard]
MSYPPVLGDLPEHGGHFYGFTGLGRTGQTRRLVGLSPLPRRRCAVAVEAMRPLPKNLSIETAGFEEFQEADDMSLEFQAHMERAGDHMESMRRLLQTDPYSPS